MPESALIERFRKEGWSLFSFEGGLQTFAETIADKLRQEPAVELHAETPCSEISFTPDNKVKVSMELCYSG